MEKDGIHEMREGLEPAGPMLVVGGIDKIRHGICFHGSQGVIAPARCTGALVLRLEKISCAPKNNRLGAVNCNGKPNGERGNCKLQD